MTTSTTTTTYDNIAVRPPYFALDYIRTSEGNIIEAQVPIQQSENDECSLISGAEVGRHLAILGSCALGKAISAKQPQYFLADYATFKLTNLIKKNEHNYSHLIGKAKGVISNRRSGEAATVLLTPDNKEICQLDVHYNILPKLIFERLFSKHAYDKPMHIPQNQCQSLHRNPCFFFETYNPYVALPTLYNVQINNRKLSCTLGKIVPEKCMGHFPGFPAMPVAILMSSLINSSGKLLKHHLKTDELSYYVVDANVSANNLAFANEIVDISTTLIKDNNNAFIFLGYAETKSGKRVGELKITLGLS